jgi:predicted kinase
MSDKIYFDKIFKLSYIFKNCSELKDSKYLNNKAVFVIGAGGSGKNYISKNKWLKYMPNNIETTNDNETKQIDYSEIKKYLNNINMDIIYDENDIKIPLKLYTYSPDYSKKLINKEDWEEVLPNMIYNQVKDLEYVIYNKPKEDSYFKNIDPDIFKPQIPGFSNKSPEYVHEISSDMSKIYFEQILRIGTPFIYNTVGDDPDKLLEKIQKTKDFGYKVSLVLVYTPLTVNHIRNLTRDRQINCNLINKQWKNIKDSYFIVKSLVDKADIIINENNKVDEKVYLQNKDYINSIIRKETRYDNLYDLISNESANEINEWGRIISI